jgi:hypothetical protein
MALFVGRVSSSVRSKDIEVSNYFVAASSHCIVAHLIELILTSINRIYSVNMAL